MTDKFDQAYYECFYSYPNLRARERREAERLGDFVCSDLAYLEQPVRRVLDLECGFGLWSDIITRHYPRSLPRRRSE